MKTTFKKLKVGKVRKEGVVQFKLGKSFEEGSLTIKAYDNNGVELIGCYVLTLCPKEGVKLHSHLSVESGIKMDGYNIKTTRA